jgi:hypothetical protein
MTTAFASALVDACARVIADAVSGHIFAAGVTESVTDAQPLVVPLADDFTEVGLPMVTCAMGAWSPALQPGNERYGRENPFRVLCAVWRPRVPLGDNVNALYGDRDAIADAFIAHTKAYLAETMLQAAILAGGPGIVPRSLGDPVNPSRFLTLPFTVNVTTNRTVVPQPA